MAEKLAFCSKNLPGTDQVSLTPTMITTAMFLIYITVKKSAYSEKMIVTGLFNARIVFLTHLVSNKHVESVFNLKPNVATMKLRNNGF